MRELRLRELLRHPRRAVVARHHARLKFPVHALDLTGRDALAPQPLPQQFLRMPSARPRGIRGNLLVSVPIDVLDRRREPYVECVPHIVQHTRPPVLAPLERPGSHMPELGVEFTERGSPARKVLRAGDDTHPPVQDSQTQTELGHVRVHEHVRRDAVQEDCAHSAVRPHHQVRQPIRPQAHPAGPGLIDGQAVVAGEHAQSHTVRRAGSREIGSGLHRHTGVLQYRTRFVIHRGADAGQRQPAHPVTPEMADSRMRRLVRHGIHLPARECPGDPTQPPPA